MMSLRSAGVLLAAVIGVVVTARLGAWQLERAQTKQALQADLDQRTRMEPLALHELARGAAEAGPQVHRRVQLRGRWAHRHTLYLDNRPMDGRSGFIVITPLLLGPGDAVLVQRGWIPRDPHDRSHLAPVEQPDGEVAVTGRLAWPPSPWLELGAPPAQVGVIRHNLDLAAFAREAGLPLRPLTVLELDPPGAAAGPLRRHWALPSHNIATHQGYAAQWFALSALIAGLYVWFQIVQPRRRHVE